MSIGISNNFENFKDLFKNYRFLIFVDILLYIDRRSFLTIEDNYIYKRSSIETNNQQQFNKANHLYKHRMFRTYSKRTRLF